MLSVNRSSVLVSAALAVASPILSGALMGGVVDGRPRGLGYVLLDWPSLLINGLPARIGGVLMASGMVPLLLYFGAYLLVCHAVRAVWRRVR